MTSSGRFRVKALVPGSNVSAIPFTCTHRSSAGGSSGYRFCANYFWPIHTSVGHAGKELLYKPSQASRTFNLISFRMARGNQRDKAREATQKKLADQVRRSLRRRRFRMEEIAVLTAPALAEEKQLHVWQRDAA